MTFLSGMVCAFVWALGLPSVPRSLYFHREVLPTSTENGVTKPPSLDNGTAVTPEPKTGEHCATTFNDGVASFKYNNVVHLT